MSVRTSATSIGVGCAVTALCGALLLGCAQPARTADGSSDADPRPADGPVAVSHGGPVRDHVSFVDALRAQGVLVEPVASVARPGLPRGTRLRLTGGGLNRPAAVESYPSRAAAVEASRMRGPDLRGRDRRVRWFGTGHLVVRYAGTDPVAVALLTDVLGPPLHASGGAARAR